MELNEPKLDEPRLFTETGLPARIAAIIEPVLLDMGLRLVRVRITATGGATLQIMAERLDGMLSVEECEAISRAVSPVLDVEDPISSAYRLEISSPGIDRPLVRLSDFHRWKGHDLKVELTALIENRRRYRGFIEGADEIGVILHEPKAPKKGDENNNEDLFLQHHVPWGEIAEARLVLTEALVEASMKKQKKTKRTAADIAAEKAEKKLQTQKSHTQSS